MIAAMLEMLSKNPFAVYVTGMSLIVILAGIFLLSLRYYIRAKDLAPYLHKVEELIAKISELQAKIDDAQIELNGKLAAITHAEKLIQQGKDAEEWLKTSKAEIETTQKSLENVRASIEAEKVHKEDLDRQISERQQQLVALEKKAIEAEKRMEDAYKGAEAIRKESAELQVSVPRLRKELSILEEEVEKKSKEECAICDQISRQKKELEEIDDELRRVKDECLTCQSTYNRIHDEVEKANQRKAELLKDISTKSEDLKALSRDLESSRTALAAAKSEFQHITSELEKKKKQLAETSLQLENSRKVLDKANGDIEGLNGRIITRKDELERLDKRLKEMLSELAAKKFELSKMESRADQARRVLADLAARREESGEKWKNLDTALIDASKLRVPYEGMDENDWLNEFSRRLPRYGFIFDDRAIKAFHTSLKCARQTPLAVLSGISGTGKSLLPELYSAALGTNFLSVPVQPRWDSPQDLFGFYNYMEGRYKATELARLLWQFDVYNNPDAKKWKKDGVLPLNIVLLDEMNLARVEYYFSDLLSKLETRNGIDSDNDLERRKAEIEVECNAADKVDSMRHLFVSPYTLFVGTMNEDESTQTLSDKVLDRANVLRFGLPKTLAESETSSAAPNKGAFIGSWKDDGRICAAEWNAWCRPLSEATDDREEIAFLNSTVQPVLMALDKVNRAYGYRVDQAMKLYVLNYPGDYRHAVSDQLEMKILPKLNGVELQDARFIEVRNALQTAIDATRDDRLKNAFAASCNTDATFFKWRGVMR